MHVEEQRYQELAGDPDHLQAMAQHYLTIANGIRNSVRALNAIHDDDSSTSKATDALKSSAQDVADDITKAESRYRITAQALLDYVPTLRSAKSDAHTAVVNIQHFQSEVDSTATALTKANDAVDTATDSDKSDATTAQTTAKTNAADAVSKLSYWRGQWDSAKGTRDAAAETAKSKINDVVQHHNNGLKNPTHHWWSDAWHWVSDHLDEIAGWLGVASLLLGWVPFLGQALLIATLVVGAIKLAKDIHDGKGWQAITGDIVGLALTAFAGGAAKYLAKAGKYEALEGLMGGTSNSLARAAGNDSKVLGAFKSMGTKPMQFAKAARGAENGTTNVLKPGMSSFLKELGAPFKMAPKNVLTELKNFAKSGGGLNIAKLGKDVSFGQGVNVLKNMPTLNKVSLLVLDGRKGLSTVQTITNATVNFSNGNWGMDPKANSQVTLTPEKVLIKNLPGGN